MIGSARSHPRHGRASLVAPARGVRDRDLPIDRRAPRDARGRSGGSRGSAGRNRVHRRGSGARTGAFRRGVQSVLHPGPRARRGTLWERLAARGFDDDELNELPREPLLRQLRGGSDADAHARPAFSRSAGSRLRSLAPARGRESSARRRSVAVFRRGFTRIASCNSLGAPRAYQSLGALHFVSASLTPGEGGEALADALREELERAGDEVRAHVRERIDRRIVALRAEVDYGAWTAPPSRPSRTTRSPR